MKSILESVVSALNNYLETHAYLFDGEYCGDETNIVSRYGFGYSARDNKVRHIVYKGDLETCMIPLPCLERMVERGLTDADVCYVMSKCE